MLKKKGYMLTLDVFIASMIFIATIIVLMNFKVHNKSTIQEENYVEDFLYRISNDKVIDSTIPFFVDELKDNKITNNEFTILDYIIYLNDENEKVKLNNLFDNLTKVYIPKQYGMKIVLNQSKPIKHIYEYCEEDCTIAQPKINNAKYIISLENQYIMEKRITVDPLNIITSKIKIMIWQN
jgi:hypothetical protein